MAKHGNKGRKRGVKPLKVDFNLALGTLASADVIIGTLPTTATKREYLISADFYWSLLEKTVNEGPISVGVSHSDYTAAEVEEALEATGSWAVNDKVAQEQARRQVRAAGQFSGEVAGDEVLNDGKPMRLKLGFYVEIGQTLDIWAWNRSGAALTTGSILKCAGIVWAAK